MNRLDALVFENRDCERPQLHSLDFGTKQTPERYSMHFGDDGVEFTSGFLEDGLVYLAAHPNVVFLETLQEGVTVLPATIKDPRFAISVHRSRPGDRYRLQLRPGDVFTIGDVQIKLSWKPQIHTEMPSSIAPVGADTAQESHLRPNTVGSAPLPVEDAQEAHIEETPSPEKCNILNQKDEVYQQPRNRIDEEPQQAIKDELFEGLGHGLSLLRHQVPSLIPPESPLENQEENRHYGTGARFKHEEVGIEESNLELQTSSSAEGNIPDALDIDDIIALQQEDGDRHTRLVGIVSQNSQAVISKIADYETQASMNGRIDASLASGNERRAPSSSKRQEELSSVGNASSRLTDRSQTPGDATVHDTALRVNLNALIGDVEPEVLNNPMVDEGDITPSTTKRSKRTRKPINVSRRVTPNVTRKESKVDSKRSLPRLPSTGENVILRSLSQSHEPSQQSIRSTIQVHPVRRRQSRGKETPSVVSTTLGTPGGSISSTTNIVSLKNEENRSNEALNSPFKILFASSSTNIDSIPNVMKYLKKHGVQVVSTVGECDIFCVGQDKELKRTSNLIMAVSSGKPVISDTWAKNSALQNRMLDPLAFLASDPIRERQWKITLAEAIERGREGRKPLSGCEIHFTPALKKELGSSFADLKDIAEYGGAASIATHPFKNTAPNTKTIVISSSSDPQLDTLLDVGWRCYSKDMVTLTVLRGELNLEDDEFLVSAKPSGVLRPTPPQRAGVGLVATSGDNAGKDRKRKR